MKIPFELTKVARKLFCGNGKSKYPALVLSDPLIFLHDLALMRGSSTSLACLTYTYAELVTIDIETCQGFPTRLYKFFKRYPETVDSSFIFCLIFCKTKD